MLAIAQRRVHDQEVRSASAKKRMQLRRIRRGVEGMGPPQHHPKMGEQVAWEESYDVQFGERKDIGTKTRFSVSKCGFTRCDASLAFGCGSVRTVYPHIGACHVPPPAFPPCSRDCLLCCHRLRYLADCAAQ